MHDRLRRAASTASDIHGDLETHITVRCAGVATDGLAAWAAARGLGFAHIVLARGRTPSQPMLNLRGEGAASAQIARAAGVAAESAADGFHPARLLERPPRP